MAKKVMKKFNGFEVIENTGSSEQVRENVAYKCGDEYRFCISVSSTNKKVVKAFGLTEEQTGDLEYYRTLEITYEGCKVRFFNDIWLTAVDDESVMTTMPFEAMKKRYKFLF